MRYDEIENLLLSRAVLEAVGRKCDRLVGDSEIVEFLDKEFGKPGDESSVDRAVWASAKKRLDRKVISRLLPENKYKEEGNLKLEIDNPYHRLRREFCTLYQSGDWDGLLKIVSFRGTSIPNNVALYFGMPGPAEYFKHAIELIVESKELRSKVILEAGLPESE